MEQKHLLIIGGVVCIVAAIALILILTGGTTLTAGTSVYENGVLTTPIHYDGEEKDVWFQYNIFRQDTLLGSTQVCESESVLGTLTKGDFTTDFQIDLPPGEYKVFIYVLERDDGTRRITGFIQNIVIA
ncbi:hypothetical protein Mlab_0738 [Methanocorpusculum labreanum Z]|uniref:DUF1616 domain-containing protein n=1 Tax=Methanocorpusculum labreanum (strain ATCC 43576 / DSM 4855 / Z) TaxID=410358 RepID=A2SRF4_METLZ|nr:hypothetical protein [Methanocorpusculum labreanum]ABN06910.1 hypothetical protein Mlab_0738 [Methanocorpusculum labreanum Z]